MRTAPRWRGAGFRLALPLLVAGVLLGACAALNAGRREEPRGAFLSRQYLARGRVAWAAGNAANARFLLGRAVELDPTSPAAFAEWTAHWPADSLPPAALAAREATERAQPATDVPAALPRSAPPAASDTAAGAEPLPAPETAAPSPGVGKPPAGAPAEAPSGGPDEAAARAEAEEPARAVEATELRAQLDRARASGDRGGLEEIGEKLLRARPHVLPDVYHVLAAWVEERVDPPATEAKIRDLLGSLEFGDRTFAAGKPDAVEDDAYLRAYRGRFLDLLGWSAFLRDDMAQAEAALRSAEREINLRGRGDVTYLRHLAAFYERKRNLSRAESYAIAAAARDTSGSGEVQAVAARVWTERHGSRAGLEARLSEEAARVRREEHAAAIAGRLYAPLPMFRATLAGGRVLGEQSLRGRVTVLVLWTPACADCRRLLADLAANPLQPAPPAQGRGQAPVEVVALDMAEPATAAAVPAGIAGGTPERARALANALHADRLPLVLVVEPAGFVQYRREGYPSDSAGRHRELERLRWQVESLVSLRPEPATSR